jgi:hypothetical protein
MNDRNPTFGEFWKMARDAELQMRGRPSVVGDVKIEMIPLLHRGGRAEDVKRRVETATEWIIDHGGSAELAWDNSTIRGVIAGVRYEIRPAKK